MPPNGFWNTLWYETKPSPGQVEVAARFGIIIRSDDTFLTASARILDIVAESIGDAPRHDPTQPQGQLAQELAMDISGDSRRVAWAKIKQETQRRNYEANTAAVERLQLKPGDEVTWHRVFQHPGTAEEIVHETQVVVSSVSWDGRVYLKGGNGGPAWAQTLLKKTA